MNEKIYLAHHGIQGQKWGVRRYQNEDGTLTDAGKKRLGFGKKNQKEKDILKNWDNMSYQEQNKYLKEYKRKAEITKSISDTIKNTKDINKSTENAGKKFVSAIGKFTASAISTVALAYLAGLGKQFATKKVSK